ncbi:hypothetical protein QQZ08_000370 [Neonectria magnoliae]|uniref:Uncharacterized protein n=1 Tax=Neonectria magnoliae TaxID=2732573 RepID=A0ABR1IHV6_9HYPO
MRQPVAPTVLIDIPESFRYGPTVLEPAATPSKGATNGTNGTTTGGDSSVEATSLDVLGNFTGTFSGFGFNTIFRPNSSKTPTPLDIKPPPDDNPDNILQLNLTSESMAFGPALGDVPNRGLDQQADISLNGVPYTQTISDITQILPPPKTQPVIHFEPGLWMRVPASTVMPNLDASFSRMASIPHGTSINAQCFLPAVTSQGAPVFPPVSITPTVLSGGQEIPFRSQTATKGDTHRLPQDLGPFIKDGTITQDVLDNPNSILAKANQGKNIIENTTFAITSAAVSPELGGGTSNIGYLIGADAGFNAASPAGRSGNANAATVTAQYWISKVRTTIDLEPYTTQNDPNKDKTVSPRALSSRDAVPKFILDRDVLSAKTVTFEYTQIQYSQNVALDFNSLRWPHVTVATLAPTALPLSSVVDY